MELTRVILGPVLTEKAERQKAVRTYTIRVAPQATKVDVQRALEKYFNVEVTSIRSQRVRGKTREIGMGKIMHKRPNSKRMIVTLHPKSKPLDLAQFQTA